MNITTEQQALDYAIAAEQIVKDALISADPKEYAPAAVHKKVRKAGFALSEKTEKILEENVSLMKVVAAENKYNAMLAGSIPQSAWRMGRNREQLFSLLHEANLVLSQEKEWALTDVEDTVSKVSAKMAVDAFLTREGYDCEDHLNKHVKDEVIGRMKSTGQELSAEQIAQIEEKKRQLHIQGAERDFRDFLLSDTIKHECDTTSIAETEIYGRLKRNGATLSPEKQKLFDQKIAMVTMMSLENSLKEFLDYPVETITYSSNQDYMVVRLSQMMLESGVPLSEETRAAFDAKTVAIKQAMIGLPELRTINTPVYDPNVKQYYYIQHGVHVNPETPSKPALQSIKLDNTWHNFPK